MSYYFSNRHELLQKAKNKVHNFGGKEKAAEHYLANKDVIKKVFLKIKKEAKRKYNKNRYKKMK